MNLFQRFARGILASAFVLVGAGFVFAEPPALSPEEMKLVRALEAQRIAAIEKVYGTVVAIYGNDRGGGGSGVLYDPAGFALTNHHVVAAAGMNGWVGLADGKLYRWKLIGTDPGGDVAIIRLLGRDDFPTAPLADSDQVRVGDWAMAMGNPFVLAEDQRPTVTLGVVSGVKRFQEGQGMNQLVYGNCIQVDSSINPGNSGGPLFDILGRIMGINGRGSFEERGRVNVGLGYAISANQVKCFIPDLLATKISRHGTLDAVFTSRGGQTICSTLNFDSPIARAGLELGDRLLEFDGETIHNANQFTNAISTLPEGYPVTVKFQRGKEILTRTVRLSALPYEPIVKNGKPEPKQEEKPEEPEEKKPEEKKPEDTPAEKDADGDEKSADEKGEDEKKDAEKKPDDKPAEGPKPMPVRVPRPNPLPLKDAGKIRDAELNATHAAIFLERWKKQSAASNLSAGLKWSDRLTRDGQAVGSQTITLAKDGRFAVAVELDGHKSAAAFDGAKYYARNDGETKEVARAKALRNPHASQAMVLGLLTSEANTVGKWRLDGGDRAQGLPSARLCATGDDSEPLYLWLSYLNREGRGEVQVLKSGVGIEDEEPVPAVQYHDWKPLAANKALFPHRRTLVRGLAEAPALEAVTENVEILSDVNHVRFNLGE